MQFSDLKEKWKNNNKFIELVEKINDNNSDEINIRGLAGSSYAFLIAAFSDIHKKNIFIIKENKEAALHLMNDLETIFDDSSKDLSDKKVLFFPSAYKNAYDFSREDNLNILHRSNVINRLTVERKSKIIVCSPESFIEPILDKEAISKASFQLSVGESVSMDFMIELFHSYDFVNVDFVTEPGQFAIRGGIIDVFAFSSDRPFRIEFSDDEIYSLRIFDPFTQESIEKSSKINILSNICKSENNSNSNTFNIIPSSCVFFTISIEECKNIIENEWTKYNEIDDYEETSKINLSHYLTAENFEKQLGKFKFIEFDEFSSSVNYNFDFKIKPHPNFAKNFDLLFAQLKEFKSNGIKTLIISENAEQIKRLDNIIEDIEARENFKIIDNIQFLKFSIHSGFIDESQKIAILTDHQIFDKYHRFKFTERHSVADAMILRDFQNIKPGDYIVHIDHGVGQYAGLEKMMVNGKEQEAIRIVYKNNDLLYVSIHSLHKLSKFSNKEGTEPQLDKIGSSSWQQKKYKAKSRVKDIANELIKLYSERKSAKGFAFEPDNYLQYELEASFMYEDTEDQAKACNDVKADMEASYPMDRLICGDVGFGKTEVAIRAAFKSAVSGKQAAILVPTTILALQHYHTFKERLKEMPVKIEYLNRFRSSKEVKIVLDKLRIGEIDIIIGTHKLLGKEVEFKDLGLLVIDEEQKFGVSAKEKIRQLKTNVDTLILTATPIPRTLQFSLLGARDLSIISTPPPNRQTVHTELINFNHRRLSEIIMYEINRGGQVFFVNNKIQNINELANIIRKICPGIRIEIGHGQMDGKELEKIVLEFIDGKFDVFISTSIVESGIDIPNANTIIINDAHNFGLSDLHQLRGRVGRSNKKAFCYLISPPLNNLTEQSRKRLKALIELSELGSGFQIAMRDLDIRGAGNLLGAEQSGFISEIGYEMYQKILDEALMEVKIESNDGSIDYSEPLNLVKDCQIETDLSILIPDNYVNNINERLMLYKDLDSLQSEKQLIAFRNSLKDRFGPIPEATEELIQAVSLRWQARKAGIEKLVLKSNKLTAFFIKTNDEAFFQSEIYGRILNWVINNHDKCLMQKSDKSQLYLTFKNINSISKSLEILKQVTSNN